MQMPRNYTVHTALLFYPKFERYRNKIIQATFSVEGSQDPPGELTDNEVLEAMQVCGSSKQLPAARKELLR